jgi:hypothetical protein
MFGWKIGYDFDMKSYLKIGYGFENALLLAEKEILAFHSKFIPYTRALLNNIN